jgi:hypothetical protein
MATARNLKIVREYLMENGAMSEADTTEDCNVDGATLDFLVQVGEIRIVPPLCGGTGRWYEAN